ncbi:ABC-type amino acid transport/signal transduction system, periplasmic component/domain [Trichinella spiralis]|uniref:ABC-type amino acid transport/signal transduction system, periplasmic component/domain n=1 Tax=Trichinella spiralis TaxID=6334 RepID=UPI0001EFC32C|nr:ABC-type amino acid transport/signal transduction system, periplasmic component/domain [Trichinella spiralis]
MHCLVLSLEQKLEVYRLVENGKSFRKTAKIADDTPLFETLSDEEILIAMKKDENDDWIEQRNKFSATQLMVVRHICDIAAQKKLSSLKHKLITDFIKYDAK